MRLKNTKRIPLVCRTIALGWVLTFLSVASTSFGAADFVDVTFSWAAPTSGSPVEYYVVQHSLNGGPFMVIAEAPNNNYRLSAELGGTHQIRVAGVDAWSRQGPWSSLSEKYTPEVLVDSFPEYDQGLNGWLTIADGDPLAPSITGEAILENIRVIERHPGGNLQGEVHLFAASLIWTPTGLDTRATYSSKINIPVSGEIHTGPRSDDDDVQQFATDLFRLHGRLENNPDFCELSITAGTDYNMPSPGTTTLTMLEDGSFRVESSIELNYRLEYTGCFASSLDGLGGLSQGTESFRSPDFIDISGRNEIEIPDPVALFQNSPNPFNPVTVISYELLSRSSHVVLDILDVRGRRVCTLVDGQQPVGLNSVIWSGGDSSGRQVPAGIYFYRLSTSHGTVVRKMAMVK